MSDKYVVMMETSSSDSESWYYFIKYKGNEKALMYISEQFNKIDEPWILENSSLFDIDIENFVSEECAKSMCMLELNSVTYHRMFRGVLKPINFEFKKTDNNEVKLNKIFSIIGNNGIEDFIDGEYIPPEHIPPPISTKEDYDTEDYDTEDSDSDFEKESSKTICRGKLPVSISKMNFI